MPGFSHIAVWAAAFVAADAYVAPFAAAPQAAERASAIVDFSLPEQITEGEPEARSSWNPLAVGVALGLFAAVVGGRAPAALAADLENGEQIFSGNCAACHAGGNNNVVPEKKLKKEALQQYGKYEIDQIKTQVTNGNGAMPAFGDRLGPDDIDDVANYVRTQADKGW